VIAIIAEGIPENKTRELIVRATRLGKHIIGPATVCLCVSVYVLLYKSYLVSFVAYTPKVGGIKPGCFKIGNTGGSIDNVIASRLYRPGWCVRVWCC
jgi:ATP citrate (pro-S)-lyase